jgi:hypothetical protein
MLADHQHIVIHPRTRLLIAGSVGLLIAAVVTDRIWVPTLGLLAQFSQFLPFVRAAIIIKLLSPLLSFLLAGGWSWVLLLLYERLLAFQQRRESTSRMATSRKLALQENRFHERSVIPQESATSEVSAEISERERPIAAPSLFQLDPTDSLQYAQLPVTPLPITNLAWPPEADQKENASGERLDDEEVAQCIAPLTQAEQILQSEVIETSSQQQLEVPMQSRLADEARGNICLQKPEERFEKRKPVTITLLKQIRAWVSADDGTTVEIKLRGGESAIRLIQLAYIAWRKGIAVDRDKMLTYVLLRGKRRDMNTDQLGEVFAASKRFLRRDLERAVEQLEKDGHPISREVDFFSNEPGFYSLHPSCKVVDLETIEDYYRTIQTARKEGLLDEKLDGSLPSWVVEACQNLTRAYPGDFLQSLLEKFPEEFGSWVKEPVTLYRDCYLDALLILANYESALGKNYFNEDLSFEQNEEQRRHHTGRAAQLFYDYAMYAINSRWDRKLKFVYRAGKDGERVIRAARAIRRCVVELGKLGNPDMIDQVYLAFKEQMSMLSEGTWKPDKDTESDVAEAKAKTTSAYRFSLQIAPHQGRKE